MASFTIEDFKNYIEKHRITDSKTNPWTISRIGSGINSGTLNITDDEFEDFMKMYASCYNVNPDEKDTDDAFIFNFTVRQSDKKFTPLMIDIDFNFNIPYDETKIEEMRKHKYNESHIKSLVCVINNIIFNLFEIKKEDFKVYLEEKPTASFVYHKKTGAYQRVKDGFHLFYNYPFTKEQKGMIHNKLFNEYQKHPEYFADIKYTNKLKEVIDSTILNNNGIILYGSYKSGHNNEKYVYTCNSYYDFDGNKYEFTSSFYDFVKLFNARQYPDDIEGIKKR